MTTKEQIQEQSQVIKAAQEEIVRLRKYCPHIKHSPGLWQWAEGHTVPAEICDECGGWVPVVIDKEYKILHNPLMDIQFYTPPEEPPL